MKKIMTVMLALIMIFAITACSEKTMDAQEEQMTQPTTEPTQQIHEDTTQSNLEDMISQVLVDYEKVYEETEGDLASNNGENIGTEADLREVTDEGVSFMAGDGENPFMPFAKRLNETDGINENNQAFYMKFKPSGSNFGFMLQADAGAGLTINEEGRPQLFVMNHEYYEDLDTDLRIEPDNWYHVLIAMGSDGLLQGAIWQDGDEDGAAYMNLHIGQSFDDGAYENQSWQVFAGFRGEATFIVEDYAYYTFSNFVMGDRVLDMSSDDQPISKDDVLFSMLMNPQELWYEGSAGFAENDGGEFGGGVKKGYNADTQRLEIFGEETGACAKFNTSLKTCMTDVGMEPASQQAVIVRFSSSDISNGARVSFEAQDEIDFWFGDDGVKFVDVANFFEMPITDYMPNNLELKDDTIYYFFFAFDGEGNIRMFIWEEGSAQNQGYFEYDLYQNEDDINGSDLIMHLGIGANSQFNLYEYWVYTFDNYMDGMPPFIMTGENQNDGMQNSDNDYGPSWTINIAGNFDIFSDMVWQSVEGRALDINGDAYVGYNLAEMMNFSQNGQDNAMIVFGQQGVDSVEVNPTSEAYIVFKKNDEFLGGPYLLFNNKMYEYPVIEVKTDY